MKQLLVFLFTIICINIISAQSPVLLEIEGDKITLEEFEMVYNKNNGSAQAIDPKTKEEYLEMYINFKLKVREAVDNGMDTSMAFVNELAGYRTQLAAPYLTDQSVTEELIKEAYERKKTDVNAFHILLSLAPDASPADTQKVWVECQRIKAGIKDPSKEFESAARKYSQDPSAQNNGGNLGYFNVFQMVYPFE